MHCALGHVVLGVICDVVYSLAMSFDFRMYTHGGRPGITESREWVAVTQNAKSPKASLAGLLAFIRGNSGTLTDLFLRYFNSTIFFRSLFFSLSRR